MKNILLGVSGLNPQVIMETIYAIHSNHQKIDAIHVLTTRAGKNRILTDILGGGNGAYSRYCKEYDIRSDQILFGSKNIHVVTDEHGVEIEDLATANENERFLKLCLDFTFELTREDEVAVFFSIAGGRKTMSACLTLAAQLYGRPQDRLFHVLVSPEFESNPSFFYPPRTSEPIEIKDSRGEPVYKETKYAEIVLVNLPFISVRKYISPSHLKNPCDPGTLMLSLIKDKRPTLTVNLKTKKIIYKTIELDVMPARLALYSFFAFQKNDCSKDTQTCKSCIDCFLEVSDILEKQDKINDFYRRLIRTRPIEEMSDTGINSLTIENFNMYKGKIKQDLLGRFGPYALKNLEIASFGKRPNTRYGILMEKDDIEMIL